MQPTEPHELPLNLYTAAGVRAMDHHAISVQGIPGIELMNRAGAATLQALRQRWPEARTLSAVCGGGNNGGDAWVVARLAHQLGWDVRAYPVTPPDELRGEALQAFREFRAAGGEILGFIPQDFEGAEILVDGLLGTGINREVSGPLDQIIQAINRYRERGQGPSGLKRAVVAIDIPSGLNADTGAIMGQAVRADLTVSFVGLKQGLFTGHGPECAGEVRFSHLDIPRQPAHPVQPSARLIDPPRPLLPARTRACHKGHFGHVLVIGGNHGYAGAARLTGEAAARTGAGLVSIATRAGQAGSLFLDRPELMCHEIEESDSLQSLLRKATVIAIGPGLGQTPWSQDRLDDALASGLPMIVDADALNLLAHNPVRRDDWILTPHPGEAARLLGVPTRDIQADRFGAVAELQSRYGGVIVLKGSGTLVQDASSIPRICRTGNPGMASGGMGDVLTGIIASLVAQHSGLFEAACKGVWVHGSAGDEAAKDGQRGLLAGDLMTPLRRLVNA